VGGGVNGQGVTGEVSVGLGCDRLGCGESRSLCSDKRWRRMTPSWQLLGNVSNFI
jgi:hypothetical protein